MPNINIYLNKELYDYVKDNPSKIVQTALMEIIRLENETNNTPSTE